MAWMGNYIPHKTLNMITYPLPLNQVSKMGPRSLVARDYTLYPNILPSSIELLWSGNIIARMKRYWFLFQFIPWNIHETLSFMGSFRFVK